MNRLLFTFILAITTITSCIKVETPEPQQVDPCLTGTIEFINNSKNPYDVFINGTHHQQQPGKTVNEKEVNKGTYTIKVSQVSGYLLYPTVQEYKVTISGCDKKVISYP